MQVYFLMYEKIKCSFFLKSDYIRTRECINATETKWLPIILQCKVIRKHDNLQEAHLVQLPLKQAQRYN